MTNAENAAAFSLGLRRYAGETAPEAANQWAREIAFTAFDRIVQLTPVDTGRARGNWQVSAAPAVPELEREDKSGRETLRAGNAAINEWPVVDSIYIANSLPYIGVLEYGGYPNPPKHGSRIRDRDLPGRRRKGIKRSLSESGIRYIVKSSGGFSIQAPLGMVGVTLAEISAGLGEGA